MKAIYKPVNLDEKLNKRVYGATCSSCKSQRILRKKKKDEQETYRCLGCGSVSDKFYDSKQSYLETLKSIEPEIKKYLDEEFFENQEKQISSYLKEKEK